MKRISTLLKLTILGAILASSILAPLPATAASCTQQQLGSGEYVDTSFFGCQRRNTGSNDDPEQTAIFRVLFMIINLMAGLVALAVVAGIVYGSIQYASAGGDTNKAKQAISVITNSIVALLLFIFMYAILNYLIPGGIL